MVGTKAQKGKQQRLAFVRQVAIEVSAVQAADWRKGVDRKAAQQKEQTGPRLIVDGPSPSP